MSAPPPPLPSHSEPYASRRVGQWQYDPEQVTAKAVKWIPEPNGPFLASLSKNLIFRATSRQFRALGTSS